MKILSIDPSSSAAGFALFVDEKPVWCKTILLKGDHILERLAHLIPQLEEMLSDDLDYIAIETPYLGISKSTSMKMGQIFGVFCAVFLMNGYSSKDIIEIHPMTAKKAAGVGHFDNRQEGKETVKQKMQEMFPKLKIDDDNSSDAVAIGLAAINFIKENYGREREANKVS
jgi:Holliday junction resolvasome RuvABC endonuclease subunit